LFSDTIKSVQPNETCHVTQHPPRLSTRHTSTLTTSTRHKSINHMQKY